MRGSYAGAIGIPQFMPGSYRRFAVDFDGDGQRDLHGSPSDAVGSVANFLKEHGWRRGEPIGSPARVVGEGFREMLAAGIRPVYPVADLTYYGVLAEDSLPRDRLATLVDLETPGARTEYWVGLQNFYAITRYNRSAFYTVSVIELARAIARASGRELP
jgi:membrane-bound lytic murein transglycosylase B